MRRSGFKRPVIERRPVVLAPLTRPGRAALIADAVVAVAKAEVFRSEPYRRLVSALPCIHCGRPGPTQAAHPNTGKGAGMKADDRLCFPLCAPRLGEAGCHARFDQGALFTKAERREREVEWAVATIRTITARGDWPAGVPLPDLPGLDLAA